MAESRFFVSNKGTCDLCCSPQQRGSLWKQKIALKKTHRTDEYFGNGNSLAISSIPKFSRIQV
jgi:hypothetical protein